MSLLIKWPKCQTFNTVNLFPQFANLYLNTSRKSCIPDVNINMHPNHLKTQYSFLPQHQIVPVLGHQTKGLSFLWHLILLDGRNPLASSCIGMISRCGNMPDVLPWHHAVVHTPINKEVYGEVKFKNSNKYGYNKDIMYFMLLNCRYWSTQRLSLVLTSVCDPNLLLLQICDLLHQCFLWLHIVLSWHPECFFLSTQGACQSLLCHRFTKLHN